MGLIDLIRGRSPGVTIPSNSESHDLSLDALIKAISSKASADKIYDPEWAPEGGWDAWCSWAYRQGRVHRSVNSLAKNAWPTSSRPPRGTRQVDVRQGLYLWYGECSGKRFKGKSGEI